MHALTQSYFGNPLWAWMAAALAVAVTISAGALLRGFFGKRLRSSAGPREGVVRSLLQRLALGSSTVLLLGISLWVAGLILTLPDKWELVIRTIASLSLATQVALWIHGVMSFAIDRGEAIAAERDPGSLTMIRTLGLLGKVALWTVMVLLALHNVGVNVTALVAGLGIGGIAVALALQNILADVFSSIAIILDKPYQVGDFIAVGDSMGTVERIGLKTTRIRSLSGEQLVFSNSELLKSHIRNFKRMAERRVEFAIGVPYNTPVEKVERVPTILREIISETPNVRLERATFKEFGESSLTVECVYFVKDIGYSLYLGVQERINLEILRRLQEEGIEPAHPNRTLYVAQGVAAVRW
jgi:small-conductance mechanosensitive channel